MKYRCKICGYDKEKEEMCKMNIARCKRCHADICYGNNHKPEPTYIKINELGESINTTNKIYSDYVSESYGAKRARQMLSRLPKK